MSGNHEQLFGNFSLPKESAPETNNSGVDQTVTPKASEDDSEPVAPETGAASELSAEHIKTIWQIQSQIEATRRRAA